MLASLMLLPLAAAVTIAPPGASDEGCPSPHQVSDALAARLPGAVLGANQTTSPATLRVTIFDPPGGGIRFQLTNADGETVLYRTLPPPPGRPADCVALSDTVALIVDRYLHEVGYEAPPLPPPAPPPAVVARPAPETAPATAPARNWQIGAEIHGRMGDTNTDGGAAGLSVGVQFLGSRLPWGLRIGGALAPPITKDFTPTGSQDDVTLHRIPLRLTLYATLPAGAGRIEPGIDLGSDLLLIDVVAHVAAAKPKGGVFLAPFADLSLGYAVPLARHVYVRVLGRGGVARPYSFLAMTNGDSVLSTPFAYLEFGVESGVSFP